MAVEGDDRGRLSGKVCVITGTGGSMGHATALAFAREGASVVGYALPALAHTTNKAGIVAMTRQLAMEGRDPGS